MHSAVRKRESGPQARLFAPPRAKKPRNMANTANYSYLRSEQRLTMKHTVLALLLVLALLPGGAAAQNIALGERVPEIKNTVWLDGHRAAPAAMTYIEFYHSESEISAAMLERLCRLCDDPECDLRLIIVTKEPVERIAPLLRPCLAPRIAVALDTSGRGFAAFGVSYLPFGVLVDAKKRALWMGNTLQMNKQLLLKITK